jgi:hypothetical protein
MHVTAHLIAIAALAALAPAAAGGKPARPELRSVCGAGAVFRQADLPPAPRAALQLAMTDPDAPFQEGDVILPGPRMPTRRLICAVPTPAGWRVHFEFGGRAYGTAAVDLDRQTDGRIGQGPAAATRPRPPG